MICCKVRKVDKNIIDQICNTKTKTNLASESYIVHMREEKQPFFVSNEKQMGEIVGIIKNLHRVDAFKINN